MIEVTAGFEELGMTLSCHKATLQKIVNDLKIKKFDH